MTWIDETLARVDTREPLFINDSKTPSGVAHVGSLRGVLTHDAVARTARVAHTASSNGLEVRFTYGCDDMDPVDEIPHGTGEHFRQHLGKPLYAAPPPPGLVGNNMAQAYFGEFTANFASLGVQAEHYYMSELYAAGRFDEVIDVFLRHAAEVRAIYRRETGAVRPDNWLPFQPICERCGRIGTTFAFDYNGETVAYECRPELVSWAQGCGVTGRISPFGGSGKLPWKLEWVAKWQVLPVTLEGAGKDHMGAGGSHKVAVALAREVLKCAVPASFTYEFFTLRGAKMSSSKGIGFSASELVACLPPEILRFLILKVQVRRALDFDLDVATLTGAFSEYEKLWGAVYSGESSSNQKQLFDISQVSTTGQLSEPPNYSPPFDSVASVVAQPHIDLARHLEAIGVEPLNAAEQAWLEVKRDAAQAWSQKFSEYAATLKVSEVLPSAVSELTNQQRAFLCVGERLLRELKDWRGSVIQAALFDAARIVGTKPAEAFVALYTAFFGWPQGPRAGSFLEFLGATAVYARLAEMSFNYGELVDHTAIELDTWSAELLRATSEGCTYRVGWVVPDRVACHDEFVVVLEFYVTDSKGRMSAHRAIASTHRTFAGSSLTDLESKVRGLVAQIVGLDPTNVPVWQGHPLSQ